MRVSSSASGGAGEGEVGLVLEEVAGGGVDRVVGVPGGGRVAERRGRVDDDVVPACASTPCGAQRGLDGGVRQGGPAPEPPALANASATVVAQRTSSSLAARYLSKPASDAVGAQAAPAAAAPGSRSRPRARSRAWCAAQSLAPLEPVAKVRRSSGRADDVPPPPPPPSRGPGSAGCPGRGSGMRRGGSARRRGRPAARPRRRRCPSPSRASCGRRAPSSTARATSRRCCSLRASSLRRRAPVATCRSALTSSVASLARSVWFVRNRSAK